MAWKTTPSASTTIETRDEPYLTAEMRSGYDESLLPRYETRQGALLPILHDIQDRHRCIPYQAMIETAEYLELTPGQVLDVVTFYEEFSITPLGMHVIAVCQSLACELCGHQALLDHLGNRLDIEPHETTDDGRVTLLALECLGACEQAPCALIDDRLAGNLTIESLDEILQSLADDTNSE